MLHCLKNMCFLGWQTLLWAILALPTIAQRQKGIDTAAIYKKSIFVARKIAKNPVCLARHLTKDYKSENEKVLAISYWIARNIKYNYKAFKKRAVLQNNTIQILRKRKALCGEYAQLFKEMCAAVGIQAGVVNGYTKSFDFWETDTLYRAEHAWSIVRINEEWRLLDFTYGSGHIARRKQPLLKLAATLFGAKYVPKFKYVHEFNPQWFDVPPDELIFTHFPNLSIYQLLEVPLSFKLFKQGGWLIHGHLSWCYKNMTYNPAIDYYLNQSQIQQWLREGEEGHENNPDNYRVKGINYYRVVDSLFRAAFDEERSQLNRSKIDLQQLKWYTRVVDSCLQLSLIGNRKELENKEKQSLAWQRRLSTHNNYHIDCLKERTQKNLSQEQLVRQIERNNHSNQKFVTQLIQKCSEPVFEYVPTLGNNWLKQRDSLQKIATYSIHQKDSLMKRIKENREQLMALKERLVLKIYEGNSKALKKLFQQKKRTFPLTYEVPETLDKDWLLKSYQRADSINQKVTHVVLIEFRENQLASYQKVKQYYKSVNKELNLIGRAKKHSKDKKEQVIYLNSILDLEQQLRNYQEELKNCLGFQQRLIRLLAQEIRQIEEATQTLRLDIALEKYRHIEYMKYRQFIQQAENFRIEMMLQRLAKIKKEIDEVEEK